MYFDRCEEFLGLHVEKNMDGVMIFTFKSVAAEDEEPIFSCRLKATATDPARPYEGKSVNNLLFSNILF